MTARAGMLTALAAAAACAATGCFLSQLPPHPGLVQTTSEADNGVEVRWFTLPNGLTVAMIPDPHANLVSVGIRYRVGSAEDPPGKPGLAHLAEHVTFAQGAEPDGPTLSERLQLVALHHNAYTTPDATHYDAIALAPELDALLALEAARLGNGCRGIAPSAFERERAIVAIEIGQRSRPGADALLAEVLGADHAYAHAAGGSVAGLTLADVCSFIDDYYAPDRAVLLIGGLFDPAALPAAVTARFGSIRHRATGVPARVAAPKVDSRTTELHAQVGKPNALVILPAAPWGSREALDEALLDDLLVRRLEAIAVRQPWILHVQHGALGGARAAVRYIAVAVDAPARLDEATALVFRQAQLIGASSSWRVSDLVERRRARLLDRFESFIGRAALCADAWQFTADRRCRLPELRELETPHDVRVAMRASLFAAGPRRVIHVLPTAGGAPSELEVPAPDAPELDARVWRAPVDPEDADRPLALPTALHTTDLSEFSLASGLRVVMASNFTQPLVDVRLVFPVGVTGGSADDVVAFAAAKLIEHDVARHYTPDDRALLRWLSDLGASLYTTVADHTTFRVRGPAAFAGWHLWRLAWLVREGVYSARELASVREVEAMRSRTANREPDGLTRRSEAVREALYGRGHPYTHARDREINARIAALTVADLERFRDRYYVPRGATLVIAGRFDPAAMRKTVIELFDGWRSPPPPAMQAVPAMRPAPGPTWLAYDDRSSALVRITAAFVATSPRAEARAARAVLGELVRGRVELIRSELLASYGFDAGYLGSPAGDVLQIDGLVVASRAGEVLRRLLSDLDRLRTGSGDLRGDFVRARRAALAAALADPSIPSATARRLEYAATSQLAITRESLAAAIASTTLRDVARVIAQDLQPTRMVGVLSGRSADTATALAAAGITGARSMGEPTARR